jgi:type IV pilus assembly protein PilW
VAADSRFNPFTAATTNIQIPSATCILYSYDADGDGTVDSNEYYGFKLEDNSIKMRKTGATTADCDDGTWEEFVDGSQLTITALQFSFEPIVGLTATSRCLNEAKDIDDVNRVINAAICTAGTAGDNVGENRLVNIRIAGELKSEGTVTKNLNGTVEVRNNRLCVWNGSDCP